MTIKVTADVQAPASKVWDCWISPEHITKWNQASEDWHTPWAKNDVRVGGKFVSRMEARDGSMGFEFGGTYDEVIPNEKISYTMDDGRKVVVSFSESGGVTKIIEEFEAESMNSPELQQQGWQAILNNFKKYVEGWEAESSEH